jgi:hypothetical protein
MNLTLIQIFLAVNIFIMGILVAIAARHAFAHFKPETHDAEKLHPQAQTVNLPPEVKEHLLQTSQAHFQTILNRSAIELEQSLKSTSTRLDKQLGRVGTDIIAGEMKRYRMDLEAIRKQAEAIIDSAQRDIVEHQGELKANLTKRQIELEEKLAEEIAEEKQELVKQIDTKLSDAVASFLIETLQHNVDLGAQSAYLTSMLEEHKAELLKEIVK